jgi:hypothetical protein
MFVKRCLALLYMPAHFKRAGGRLEVLDGASAVLVFGVGGCPAQGCAEVSFNGC